IHLAIVPEEIELPQIAVQIFAANVVIDADQSATNQSMAAFRSVHVNVATCVFHRAVAHRLMRPCPALLEPAISGKFISHQIGAGIDISLDSFAQRLGGHISNYAATELPAALYGAKYRSLGSGASRPASALIARPARSNVNLVKF